MDFRSFFFRLLSEIKAMIRASLCYKRYHFSYFLVLIPLLINPQTKVVSGSVAPPKSFTATVQSNSRTNKSIMSPQLTEASALRELKEIIQSQKKEIEDLKSALAGSKKPATKAPIAHGHGPPVDDSDPSTYISSPFYKLALQRVGWLFLFLCSLSLTALIMNGFEHTLSKQIELAYFVPLLAGHGGNTGGQTVGSVLSALSTGAATTKDAFRIIRKEAMSGMTVGFILGTFVGIMAHYFGGISSHVSMVVFCTLPLLSTIAATLASSIPFACKALGLDPAIIAAPAMTTFVDVTGLMSYFLIANRIFKWYGLEL